MHNFFLTIFDMSMAAGIVILAVLVLRLFLKRMPKVFSYVLWLVVLFRLFCPWQPESRVSLIPKMVSGVAEQSALKEADQISMGETLARTFEAVGDAANGGLEILQVELSTEAAQESEYVNAYHYQIWMLFLEKLWPIGSVALLAVSAHKLLKLRKRLTGAVRLRLKNAESGRKSWNRVFLADGIATAFVIGLIHPRIYLPSGLSEQEQQLILFHERYHIRRFDHVVKLLFFAALCLHWFNPLVWLAFALCVKDMEMSCDEAVTKTLDAENRAEYSQLLLNLATGQRSLSFVPLAFGEGDTGSRIKNILRFKKPKRSMVIATVLVLTAAIVLLLLNPISGEREVWGADYAVAQTLYERPIPPEMGVDYMKQYSVTADHHLYGRMDEEEEWSYIGKMESYDRLTSNLNQKELEGYLQPAEYWKTKSRPGTITDAYIVRPQEEGVKPVFYLVMQTKQGETLLGIGWEDVSERYQEGSDDTYLFLLYELENLLEAGKENENRAYLGSSIISRSIESAIGKEITTFQSYYSDKFEGYLLEAFVAGDTKEEMTDMGYAVFQLSEHETGYRLLDVQCYEDAALTENGLYIGGPAVMHEEGLITDKTAYDVIFVNNKDREVSVTSIHRILHYADGTQETLKYSVSEGFREVVLLHWEDGKKAQSESLYFYDVFGNEVEGP